MVCLRARQQVIDFVVMHSQAKEQRVNGLVRGEENDVIEIRHKNNLFKSGGK